MTYLETNKDIIEKVVNETINEGTAYEMQVKAAYLIDGSRRELNHDGTPKDYIKPLGERSHLDDWLNHEKRLRGEKPAEKKSLIETWRNSGAIGEADDPYGSEHENIDTMSENNFVEPEETETVTEETTDEPITEKTDEFVGEKDGIKVVKRDEDPGMGRSTITRFFFIHPDGSEEKIGSVAVASVRKKIENFLEA